MTLRERMDLFCDTVGARTPYGIVPVGFSNVIVMDREDTLLQYRVPERKRTKPLPYALHYSTWGGKWEPEDGGNPDKAVERELQQELPMFARFATKVEPLGIYALPLPSKTDTQLVTDITHVPKNVDNLIHAGFTHWLNWMYVLHVPDIREVMGNTEIVDEMFVVPEGFAQIHPIHSLPQPMMSEYGQVIQHVADARFMPSIPYGQDLDELERKILDGGGSLEMPSEPPVIVA